MRQILVVDFDGTLAMPDIGDALCERFAPPEWRAIDELWIQNRIPLPEAQRRMWGLVRAPREQMVAAALAVGRLRPGLDALLDGAQALGVPVWLASGGFDFYIEALLGARQGRFARRYDNGMRFFAGAPGGPADHLEPVFRHPDLSCDRCAVCKGNVCDAARALAPRVVFAGDGTSDRCVIGRADALCVVRGSLLHAEADRRGAPFTAFDRLDEILAVLDAVPA